MAQTITTAQQTALSQLYVAFFNRAADSTGLGHWADDLLAGKSIENIAQSFYNTDAARPYYSNGQTADQFIETFYSTVLGRAADTEGKAYWVAQLKTPGQTQGSVAVAIVNAVTAYAGTDAAALTSKALFNAKVLVSTEYALHGGTDAGAANVLSGVVDAATAAAAITKLGSGVAGSTFTLTTGVDALTGTAGNDTFTVLIDDTAGAVKTTLTALDVVNGGDGNDTMNLNALTAVTALPAVTVSGIETLNVRAAAAFTADVSTWTGLTAANVTQGAAVALTAAATTNVSVSGATGTIATNGGLNTTVAAATAGQAVTIGATTVGAGAVSVTHTNQTTGDIAIDGGTTVAVTASNATTGKVTVGSGGATIDQPSGAIAVTTNGAAYAVADAAVVRGLITTTGGTSVAVNQTATSSSAAAATDTTTVGNTVTQSAITVNGGANTTTATVNQSAAVAAVNAQIAVAGAQEVQTVTFAAMAAATNSITVNGLTFTAAKALTAAEAAAAFAGLANGATQGTAPASNGVYSGTFSTISGSTSAVTTTSTASTVNFTSTDKADIAVVALAGTVAPTAATTVAGSAATTGITGVMGVVGGKVVINGAITGTDVLSTATLAGFGASSTVASDALTSLTLANSNQDVTVTNAAATTLALSLNAVGTSADNADANLGATYTTLNIATSDADSDINVVAGGVTALNVSGTNAVVLTGSTLGALKTLTVTGSAGVTGDVSGATVTAVNTAGTTGTNTITIDATKATYTGGAGVDAVTLSAVAPSKAVSLGAGDDSLTLATGTTTSTGTLSGGDGTDTLVMAMADAITASATTTFQAAFNGFEKFQVNGSVGGAAGTVNMANLDNINYVINNQVANVSAVAQVSKFVIAQAAGAAGMEAADSLSITLGGTVFTKTGVGYSNMDLATAALAAVVNANAAYGATYDAFTHTMTVTAATAGTAFSVADVVFVDDLTVADNGTISSTNTTPTANGTTSAASGLLTVDNLASGGTVELAAGGAGATVLVKDAATGLTDVLNVVTKVSTTDLTHGTVTAANVESIHLTVTDTSTTAAINKSILTLTADKAIAVTVTGNAALDLTMTGSTHVTSIDGSAMTGGLTVTSMNTTSATTITGGSGNDVLTAATGTTADILLGGAGNDTLVANKGLSTLTGGAGNDIFQIGVASANVNSYSSITDFAAGDSLQLTGATSFAAAKVSLGDTAVFQDYANAAVNALAANASGWFQFAGNTYVVEDAGADSTSGFINGQDFIVKLTGLVDLSSASFNSTHSTIALV